jgi:hypothetical protein
MDFLYVRNGSAVIRSTYERRSLEISYGIPRWRPRALIRKVAYTKYDATGLVRWSNFTCFTLVSSFPYSSTLKMEACPPPKRQFTFNGLHVIISQRQNFKTATDPIFHKLLLFKRQQEIHVGYHQMAVDMRGRYKCIVCAVLRNYNNTLHYFIGYYLIILLKNITF